MILRFVKIPVLKALCRKGLRGPKPLHRPPVTADPFAVQFQLPDAAAARAVSRPVAAGIKRLSAADAYVIGSIPVNLQRERMISRQNGIPKVPAQQGSCNELGAGDEIPVIQQQAVAVIIVGTLFPYQPFHTGSLGFRQPDDLTHG